MRAILALLLLHVTTACYTVALQPIPEVEGERLGPTARIEIPPETADFTYDVRAFVAGAANRWRIKVGEALEQYAHAYLTPVFPSGDDLRIRISIEDFDVHDFEAHVDAHFSVYRGDDLVMSKKYHANGIGHLAQTLWSGAFAMKSSMRKTTSEALRSLFEQFVRDVSEDCGVAACAERDGGASIDHGLPQEPALPQAHPAVHRIAGEDRFH